MREISSSCFNPLFIGSKDATRPHPERHNRRRRVSIPFSSGQRMQPMTRHAAASRSRLTFQSPFHRVKGCNEIMLPGGRVYVNVSIPFSSGQRMQPFRSLGGPFPCFRFQSPFHRVKGCNLVSAAFPDLYLQVSIPFSSGQRMQRPKRKTWPTRWSYVSIPFSSGQRMQPPGFTRPQSVYPVSIPFSSGQRMQH